MSTKLVLLLAAVITFLVIFYTSKGINRVILVLGILAMVSLAILLWSGGTSLPELLQSFKDFFNA